jgi:hypothetical protein
MAKNGLFGGLGLPQAGGLMQLDQARRLEACPVGVMDDSVVVAIDDPAEVRFKQVRQLLGEKTLFVLVTPTALRELYLTVWSEPVDPGAPSPPEPEAHEPAEAPATSPELVSDARDGLTALVERSAADRRELDDCRARLVDHDRSRRADLERIERLEGQLAQRARIANELKTKLGDFVSGLDAVV